MGQTENKQQDGKHKPHYINNYSNKNRLNVPKDRYYQTRF